MSGCPGRPRADRITLLEQIVEELLRDPDASANTIQRRVAARRHDVLRAVRSLRDYAPTGGTSVSTTSGSLALLGGSQIDREDASRSLSRDEAGYPAHARGNAIARYPRLLDRCSR